MNPTVDQLFIQAMESHQKGELKRAHDLYQQILQIDSTKGEIWNNLGVILRDQGDMIAALACFKSAVHFLPHFPAFQMNLGDVYARFRDTENAKIHLKEVVKIEPNFVAALYALANIYMTEGNFDLGHEMIDRVLLLERNHLGPKWTKAFGYLMAGDYDRGFPEWECRLELLNQVVPRPNIPTWKNENLSDKILLLYGEQGLGDIIQFVRFIKCLPKDIKEIIFEVPKELRRVLEYSFKNVRPITFRNHGSNIPYQADFQISVLSLPSRLQGFPTDPYLFAASADFKIQKPMGVKKSIGICWAGSPTHQFDSDRSSNLRSFFKGLAGPGRSLYSLQVGAKIRDEDSSIIGPHGMVVDLGSQFSDFADTANAIAQLDVIVAVDTGVAHLVGAMGKRCHLLLPFYGLDWRWGLSGSTTRWYPSMTLHRRHKEDCDWTRVLQEISDQISAETA